MRIKGKQLEDTLRTEATPFSAVYSSDFAGNLTGAVRFKAKNTTGGVVAKGSAVYINGVSGDVPTIALADADNANTMPCVGLTEASSNNNAEVNIISFGNLTGLNTAALGTNIVGDTVYISTTAGSLTLTAPTGSSSKLQNIGQIVREHATDGIIKVGGAGRTAATPNLDSGKFFIGGTSNNTIESNYTLPIDDGSNGQALITNGSGAVSFGSVSASADSLATGTSAVSIATSAGDITLDAQGSDTDIIFKGTDGALDVEMLRLDASDGGTAIFNNDIILNSDTSVIKWGADSEIELTHQHNSGLILKAPSGTSGVPILNLQADGTGNQGPKLFFKHNGSDANNDVVHQTYYQATDSASSLSTVAIDQTIITNNTSGSVQGSREFYVTANNSSAVVMKLEGSTTASKGFVNIPADANSGLKIQNVHVTATGTEINIMDGNTAASNITLVDTDNFVVNDNGVMRQVALSKLKNYIPNISFLNFGRSASITGYTGASLMANTVDGVLNGQGYCMPFDGYIRTITIQFDCTAYTSTQTVYAHIPGYSAVGAGVSVTSTGDFSAVFTNTNNSSPYSFSAGDNVNIGIRHTGSGLTTENHAIIVGVAFT